MKQTLAWFLSTRLVSMGSYLVSCRFKGLVASYGCGIGLGSVWDRFEVGSGSVWDRFGIGWR